MNKYSLGSHNKHTHNCSLKSIFFFAVCFDLITTDNHVLSPGVYDHLQLCWIVAIFILWSILEVVKWPQKSAALSLIHI